MRKLVIRLLKLFNPGTIKIRHHFTKKTFYLDAFRHKGYWYYGKKREKETIFLFMEIIPDCNFVIEVGAHIGYFSQFFSELISENGKLIIFEPGINNLPYLKKNISFQRNIRLVEKAVSNKNGKANFYIENLSGQNNSLLSNYKRFDDVLRNSGVTANKKITEVKTVTLDSFIEQDYPKEKPDFIKLDIEGAELYALQGMKKILDLYSPILMVEVTENISEVLKMLHEFDYILVRPNKEIITNYNVIGNVFCIHKSKKELLNKLNIVLS